MPAVEPNAPSSGLEVKGLEWKEIESARSSEDPSTETTGWEASAGFASFYTVELTGGGAELCDPDYETTAFDDPEAAKAAAQADYRSRILSALSIPAPDTGSAPSSEGVEPVAWRWRGPKGGGITDDVKPAWPSQPLYAAPPAHPQTEESLREAFEKWATREHGWRLDRASVQREVGNYVDWHVLHAWAAFQAGASYRSPPASWRPTHRHKKTGGEYMLLDVGKMQAGEWWATLDGRGLPQKPIDMREVAIYQGKDGKFWVRPVEEWGDGRFEPLPTPSSNANGEGA